MRLNRRYKAKFGRRFNLKVKESKQKIGKDH